MAKQIKSFGMARMSIGSCADFHHQVMKHITTATPAALHIEDKTEAYEAAIATLDSIVNRQRAFVSTKVLADADRVRDNAVSIIIGTARLYRKSPVAEQSAAAELLYPQFSAYKDITRHEYSKQTAEVRGLLAVLAVEENKAAAATLGLTEVVAALQTANATFEESTTARTAEISGRIAQSDLSSGDALDAVNDLYKGIVQVVNAYAVVQPTDAVNTFIDSVNGVVEYYSRIAGSSASGGSASEGGNEGGGSSQGGGGSQGGTDDGSDDGEL